MRLLVATEMPRAGVPASSASWLLDCLHKERPVSSILYRDERFSADHVVRAWAAHNRIPLSPFWAAYWQNGDGASDARDRNMFTKGKPDMVLCIGKGRGVDNITRLAGEYGVVLKTMQFSREYPTNLQQQ